MSDLYISKTSRRMLEAHRQGYRITDGGVVLKPDGTACYVYDRNKRGLMYTHFNVRIDGKPTNAPAHRLQAYQKFGNALFHKGVVVRHLNGNSLDNSASNISLGTQKENAYDRDPEVRQAHAKKGAATLKKLTPAQHKALLADRASGMTYKELMAKYGLAKSTVSYIVRGITYQ